ncbi:MAG: amidohydrolase [Chloroflexota bacterium]
MHDVTPDLVLYDGHIRTMEPGGRTKPSAISISGDRILGLGTDADILAQRGPGTRVIDLCGRTVTPGFTDAHCHPVFGGLRRVECSLDRFSSVEDHLAAVAAFAAANPERAWISGDGWSLDTFPGGIPRRELLDAVVPDRPVYLSNRDGHGAWVNTRALELAGVTAETPDPPHGRIERDPDGTPLGMLQETAMELVAAHIPPHDGETLERAVLDAQAQYHAWGITGWNDAMVDGPFLAAYRAVAGQDRLTARVVLSLRSADLEGFGGPDGIASIRDAVAAEAAAADPARPGAARLSAGSAKFFVDGILESRTGALLEPYSDPDGRPSGDLGFLNFEPAELQRLSSELDARGLDLHYHAIGDRAVREALDAIEAVRRANGPRDRRPHIAHIQVIHPDDVPRFAALDVIPNAQPLWAVHEPQMDELTIPILGPVRTTWQYPFASLLRAGARLAMGSDWTVSTADPFPQIEVATRRVWPGHRDAEPFLPSERLTLEEALRAATVGSAYVNRQDEAGWLGVGRLADLAILDHDIDAPDAPPIGETKVVATIVGGELVHEAPALEV